MLTQEEIKQKLYQQAQSFHLHIKNKEYLQAKFCYDTARNVALFVQLGKEDILELFGSRQIDPPVEGLFSEQEVQEAYYEVSVKRKNEERLAIEQEKRRERRDQLMRIWQEH